MDEHEENFKDIFRYTDVEYTPDGYSDVYRWDDFLGIAGGHVYSAMDTIDSVSPGGEYEGDEPEHAYACEIVACCGLSDGVALFRPVSHDGADLIQVAFLRNDVDDATGAYTERFEAGSFDLPAADFPRSESGVDLLEYFSGRSFKHTPGVSRGLDPREAVDSIEDAIGCDLGLFDGFWLGVPGEADMRVGPYTKKSLLDFSYYAKELSCRYGFADSDILEIADTFAQEIKSRLDGGKLGHGPYVDSESLRDDLTERFGFFYDIDFSGLTFKTSLILSVKSLYFEGDVVDSALDWQADYLPCVCHRGGQGENDRWEYEPTDDYRPFTRPADIPESIFDKLCASQGTTIEKVVNDPVTKFERSFREDIFNSQQNSLVGLTVLATLPLDAFLDASLSMICRGDREKAGTFTVKPGTYEPIMGIYDPINGCGGTAGIELDTDFDIDPRDIKYTMMEPRGGKWESDRIDLYTPQDCFGFSEPFAGRIEYSEKKPKIAAKAKPDPADLGRRASVAAGATVRDGVDGGGIKL